MQGYKLSSGILGTNETGSKFKSYLKSSTTFAATKVPKHDRGVVYLYQIPDNIDPNGPTSNFILIDAKLSGNFPSEISKVTSTTIDKIALTVDAGDQDLLKTGSLIWHITNNVDYIIVAPDFRAVVRQNGVSTRGYLTKNKIHLDNGKTVGLNGGK